MNKQEKFMSLFDPVQSKLERFAYSLVGNREDAKEIVSETVMIAYEHLESLRSEQAFLSYMFTIARRVRIDKYRKNKRMHLLENDSFDLMYSKQTSADDMYDIKLLYKAMEQLSEKSREAIILAEIFGFSHKEIGKIQASSIAAVKVRIHRSKRKLKALLTKDVDSTSQNTSDLDFEYSERGN